MRGRTARGGDAGTRTGTAPVAEDGAEQRIVAADGSTAAADATATAADAAQKIGARHHRRPSRTRSRRGGRGESAEEVVDVAQGAEGI